MGCARDIVENTGVPRFYWSDFPLGHSAGKPHDVESQLRTLAGALAMFDSVTGPRATHVSEQRWAADEDWQADFMSIAHLDPETLRKLKAKHETDRATLARLKD